MKHIALLKSNSQRCGGLEKYASRIATAFANRGDQVNILTTGSKIPPPSPQIAFHRFPTSRWPSFLRMEQFDQGVSKWVKSNQPDIIFGMDRNRFQTHFRAGNGVHISYLKSRILTEGRLKHLICRLNPMHRKILELEKIAIEHPDLQKVFANSHMVQKEILEYYNISPSKIVVIHNGVEWREMESSFSNWPEMKQKTAIKLKLDPDCFHFLFIGNGYLRKGLSVLLKALSQMKGRDFHLSVVGKDNDIDSFQSQAMDLNLKNKVRFFGSIEDITPFYQLADALVIPSFYDPFANVTIEALAMGLQVVSSKYNGGHEILGPENGIVIEDLLSVDCLAKDLQSCLSKPKTPLSANKIRQSVSHLDFSKQLKKLIDHCE
jgi:UDP-glucose:(heptosyl)LPS alpha-1,3-glucosyltransferase